MSAIMEARETAQWQLAAEEKKPQSHVLAPLLTPFSGPADLSDCHQKPGVSICRVGSLTTTTFCIPVGAAWPTGDRVLTCGLGLMMLM